MTEQPKGRLRSYCPDWYCQYVREGLCGDILEVMVLESMSEVTEVEGNHGGAKVRAWNRLS